MTEAELRETVRCLYDSRCGYCGVHESEAATELEVDHFQPRSAGGTSDIDNLVYCCTACNRLKGSFWAGVDIDTSRRLLHPRRDDLAAHLRVSADGLMIALTATGEFHLERLHLNRPPLVALRRRRIEVVSLQVRLSTVEAEQTKTRTRIAALEQGLQRALDRIERLGEP